MPRRLGSSSTRDAVHADEDRCNSWISSPYIGAGALGDALYRCTAVVNQIRGLLLERGMTLR